jgi:hypothetical protein
MEGKRMTKSELVKALEGFDDNAEVYVQIADSINEGLYAHAVEDYEGNIIIVSNDAPDYLTLVDYADACVKQENLDYEELESLKELSADAKARFEDIQEELYGAREREERERMHEAD